MRRCSHLSSERRLAISRSEYSRGFGVHIFLSRMNDRRETGHRQFVHPSRSFPFSIVCIRCHPTSSWCHSSLHLSRQQSLNRQSMINNNIFQHFEIEGETERSGAHWRNLSKQNVLRNSGTIILLPNRSGLHQNFHCLFERTPHQCSSRGSIDAVTSDGH